MPVIQLDILGSPNIGTYTVCSDKVCLVPFGLTEKKMEQIGRALSAKVYPFGAGGSILNGSLVAMNSNGILLPRTASEEEVRSAESATGLAATVLNSRYTALGNLVLANDRGAIVDPRFSQREVRRISEALNVEASKGWIGGLPYVGSLAVATNKGALTHPSIRDDEKRLLEEVLRVESEGGTVNGGVPFPKLGVVTNSHGLVAGPLTTGHELAVLTRILRL